MASYWGVQGNGFINYDDPAYVLENRHVKGGLSGEGKRFKMMTYFLAIINGCGNYSLRLSNVNTLSNNNEGREYAYSDSRCLS